MPGLKPAALLTDMAQSARKNIISAAQGFGPFLQRDYWAVISECRVRPSEIIARLAADFWDFAPSNLCQFKPVGCEGRALRGGDLLSISIPMAPSCEVRVLHMDAQSLTLGTLEGHPEAGRITFGAYRNDLGDVVFHIRSRARSGSLHFYFGFVAVGEAMQTNTWTEFVNRVAATFGSGAVGPVHAETLEIEDETLSTVIPIGPTFAARGD